MSALAVAQTVERATGNQIREAVGGLATSPARTAKALRLGAATCLFRQHDGQAVDGALTRMVTGDKDDVTVNGNTSTLTAGVLSTFELAGLSPFTVTVDSYVFDARSFGKVGFGVQKPQPCCDIIQHQLPVYDSYDLLSSIGPINAPANLSLASWVEVPTTAGLFTVTSMTNNSFQAIIEDAPTVPEPSSILLGFAALAILGASTRARRLSPRRVGPHPAPPNHRTTDTAGSAASAVGQHRLAGEAVRPGQRTRPAGRLLAAPIPRCRDAAAPDVVYSALIAACTSP